jgi:hypothetical protein
VTRAVTGNRALEASIRTAMADLAGPPDTSPRRTVTSTDPVSSTIGRTH